MKKLWSSVINIKYIYNTNKKSHIRNGKDITMLYIMRHGKTDWNELHKLQGHTDIPLNANGIAMAENAAKEYKNGDLYN